MTKTLSLLAAGVIALGLASSPAMAAASRTFVSATPPGSDTGTCPNTAPCRTFAYALTQTAASGEIIVLSSGGYGAVTISQAVSIINTSNFAGVTVAGGGTGITINAGVGDSVTLRGLTVDGGGAGSNGIVFNSGAKLTIDQCNVLNFTNDGILMQPTSGSHVAIITNTTASNNDVGVLYLSGGTATTGFVIDHVTATNNNSYGFDFNNGASSAAASASVANSIASENGNSGFVFINLTLSLDMSYASGNQRHGVELGSGATFFMGRSVLMNNGLAGLSIQSATANSYKNNQIAGNGTDVSGGTLTPVNTQ